MRAVLAERWSADLRLRELEEQFAHQIYSGVGEYFVLQQRISDDYDDIKFPDVPVQEILNQDPPLELTVSEGFQVFLTTDSIAALRSFNRHHPEIQYPYFSLHPLVAGWYNGWKGDPPVREVNPRDPAVIKRHLPYNLRLSLTLRKWSMGTTAGPWLRDVHRTISISDVGDLLREFNPLHPLLKNPYRTLLPRLRAEETIETKVYIPGFRDLDDPNFVVWKRWVSELRGSGAT